VQISDGMDRESLRIYESVCGAGGRYIRTNTVISGGVEKESI